MSEQSEERLFIGITPNGIETCREPDIRPLYVYVDNSTGK